MEVVLGRCEVALGGGLRLQWQHWAAAAAEGHAMMVLASALSKPRASYYNIGISVCEDSTRGRVQFEKRTLTAMVTR
jgi:hypothetical protein